MAAGFIDLDTPGKYPIVLSDALLGKTSTETYTGIRCLYIYIVPGALLTLQ